MRRKRIINVENLLSSPRRNRREPEFTLPREGQRISFGEINYYIGKKVNDGGFGDVYECSDDWGNRLVAKIIRPNDHTYQDVKRMWRHEKNMLLSLRHPNITYIYDYFEYRDTFYLILEYCDDTLDAVITNTSVNGEDWIPIVARDILCAIHYIHDEGFIHKDLHPGNIFIFSHLDSIFKDKKPVYNFKVGDLGISREKDDIREVNTYLAQWMLPPEYLIKRYGELNSGIDIYHVGLLLLALLLNDIPDFTNREIISGEPRKLAKSLNSPFSRVISSALRRHVNDRTQTALELWKGIERVTNRRVNTRR